jgi:hypothetical protein
MRMRILGAGSAFLVLACVFAARADDTTWDWRLAGVIAGPGVGRALFARDGETRSVAQGGSIDGWTLVAVRGDGVTLEAGQGRRNLLVRAPVPAVSTDAPATSGVSAASTVASAARAQQQDQAVAERALAIATRMMTETGPPPTSR